MGIEPTWSAWEAEVLPLNYTYIISTNSNSTMGRSVNQQQHSSSLLLETRCCIDRLKPQPESGNKILRKGLTLG